MSKIVQVSGNGDLIAQEQFQLARESAEEEN
jgi:hypothetical protein